MSSRRPLFRRIATVFLTVLVCGTFIVSPLTVPTARAIPVEILADAPSQLTTILDTIFTQLVRAGTVALFNAAQTFLGQVAYDAANYVASGGKGQSPLTQAKSPGDYFSQIGEDALGSAIGSLSDDFFESNIGFDLCKPSVDKLLNLQLSLGNFLPSVNPAFTRPKPNCSFKEIVANYNQFYTTLTSKELLSNINASFNTNASDVGAALQIFGRTAAKVSTETGKKKADRAEDGAFKGVTDVVSGDVKTPAGLIKEQTSESLIGGPNISESGKRTAILSSAADQGFVQLAMYTASMFVNTLGSKLMSRIMEKGLIDAFDFSDLEKQTGSIGGGGTTVATANPDAIPSRGRADARRANLALRDVNLIRQSNIEITAELIACTDVRGTWNCVMDQQLAQAVRGNACDNGSCTIVKALDRDLLKGDWKLFPDSMVRQNQDRNCYNQAYCAGNLRKLRLMRIVPVGLEFAANSDANIERCASAAGCVSLKEVVDNFTNCGTTGERDATHPWCKLVDPSWVLASFEQQCRLTGFGDQLLSDRLAQRKEECSDIQTCLKRNDKGECVGGFGYCVAEKTVYRFKADECSAQAASCRNFTTRANTSVSYLRSTLDYGVCSADNVGCLGYATIRRPDGSWINAATSTTYFDQTLKSCGASDEGCTRLLAAEVGGSSLNLLTNASFERTSGVPVSPVSWSLVSGSFISTPLPAGSTAIHGTQALVLQSGDEYAQRVAATPGTLMTASVFARAVAGGDLPVVAMDVVQFSNDTFSDAARISGAYSGAGALFKSTVCTANPEPQAGGTGYGTDWRRFECSFLTSSRTRFIELSLTGKHTFIDAVQLEEGQFATNYTDGTNNALPVVYMKVASDDFQCTGGSDDPASCGSFARVCRQVDAGCQGYTDGTSAPEIPAILSSNDLCPAECVGYAEYRKQGASFDLVVDADTRFSDPSDDGKANFIPATATQCSQQDVGCEVFTNLESAAAGGEQTAAYSYLRLCEKPSANSQTYFTWEGSETTGYQLRTWALVGERRDVDGIYAPKIVPRRGPDGTFKDPSTCDEGMWRTGLDADCRQYYDRAGTVFYAFFSQTVLSSAECKPLRISGRVNTNDCSLTGGSFNVSTGECSYNAMPSESLSCNVQLAGCRAYAGAGAGGGFLSVNENFRSGPGSFTSDSGAAPSPSPESLLVGDQSLRLQGASYTTRVSFESASGDLFRVSFWAKGVGAGSRLTLQVSDIRPLVGGATPVAVGQANLSGDWQRFSFGLFGGFAGAPTSSLSWTLTGSGTPVAFLDEVRVERVRDTAYVVKDSWNTPIACDQTFSGIPEPQAMLGCRQYTDRFQNKINASRFTRLCRQEAIGCRAFVDTRNSDSSEAQSFASADLSPIARRTFRADEIPTPTPTTRPDEFFPSTTTIRPADRMRYLVYETSKLCQSENMSCRAFGKPVYSTDRGAIESFETVYVKDDITAYSQAMCRPSEEFCEEFSYQSAKDYFKDPGDKSCEYKEGVRMSAADVAGLADGTYSGWFRKGGNSPCYPENLQGGNFFGLPKRGDEPYAGWVGLCLPENGECTEFRDPNDTSDPQFRSGRPYYFVDNTKLDKTTCSGNADQGSGCILLRNQSNPTLDSSSLATDLSYRANNFRAVLPINCTEDPSNEFCQGRCRGTKSVVAGVGRPAVVTPYVGAVCSATEPCVAPTEAGATFAISCITPQNDANVLVKVSTDRDCSQWLGCQSAETVFDPVTSQYKDVCTNLALCNKTTDTPGDIFCANYVDRNNATLEPVMTQGKYFDIANYSSRQTGLGTNDYSGYAIPDSFQIPDTLVARVGVDGAKTVTENENRFANDYRLAAVARIPVNLGGRPASEDTLPRTLGPNYAVNEARVLEGAGIGAANPGLFLCQHVGSGIIGYYRKDDRDNATSPTASKAFFNCYLPLRQDSDSYNFQNLVGTFGLDDPRVDPVLAKAFPAPECRANPEADSPFGTKYVTGWDLSTNPPKPILKINGYTNANVCAYGEDCSCSYKRAEYEIPTLTRFYSPLSGQVSPGVCSGGPRDGQSCLPTSVLSVGVGSAALQGGIAAANAQQLCGTPEQGGRCIASTKIEVIRGIFGQCLERDSTRILGDDRAANPCLTWNPNPILFGEKDPFHFQPTSGYLPPQNSGQYYCTSPSGEPVAVKMDKDSFATFSGSADPASSYYAGLMKKIDYSGIILQSTSADTGPSLIAADPSSRYPTAIACTEADIPTSRPGGTRVVERYPTALRLVDAGSGYSETFFRINDQDVASGLGATVAIEYDRFLSDNTIGYLRASPAQGIGGGLMACGYQAGWVDTISSVDYTSAESMRQAERQFRDEFSRSYVSYMTRGSEKVLSVGALGEERAVKMPCLDVGGAARGTDCYFKYWETGFQAQGQRQFDGIFAPNSDNVARSLDSLRRNPVISSRCESGKPYFAIRSMFQSRAENTEGGTAVDAGKVQGPWRFVGFWVSACAGNAGSDQRYIYMDLEVGGTNVCTELAEVQSINSRQDAAFTDRVWSQGGFREQNIGTTYSDAAAPFSSAINTGPAGKQPLFQDGQELTGFSPLNPPTFLRSGITTYYKPAQYPRDKWAYLTNIFARIYRVYHYNFDPVNRGDAACLAGPFKGAKCTTPDTTTEDTACKIDGSCLPSLMSSAERDSMRVCNRGVSAGLACSTNEECQGPSFAGTDSRLHTLQAGCLLRTDTTSWLQYSSGSITDENALFYNTAVDGGRYKTRQEAAALHAFACSTLSGRANLDCSAPTGILGEDEGKSPECPALLIAGTCSEWLTGRGVCDFSGTPESDFIEAGLPGRPIVACLDNNGCRFTRPDFDAASCAPAGGTSIGTRLGRCGGGLRSGQVCLTQADVAGASLSCNTSYGTDANEDAVDSSCGPVDSLAPNFDPVDACQVQNTSGPNTSTDPDNDTNLCTHSAGYQPRQDLCPNPSDEYCGLIAYDISTASAGTGSSVDPAQRFPLPTDVTLGHYTPTFLGFSSLNAAAFNYITYYTPRPPRLAAPDTRNCAVPGQCPISRLDAISLDGLADGSVMGGGGQHKSNLRFYAWAAHEQMPLRKVTIDWGDDKTQVIDDTRLKNRKPFCGVQKECKLVAGLTCQIDSDCPPGAGTCVSVGTCEKTPQRTCNADTDCTVGGVKDTCNIRTMFGNASEACQQDYFDFAHVYTCGATEARSLPSCTASVGGGAYIPAGQCYFGAVDGFLMGGDALGGVRPTCSTTDPAGVGRADCLAAYRAIPGTPPTAVLPSGSSCSAPVAATSLVSTRCSRDPARACSSASDCAAGDTCIDSLAPPSGCFDAASNSCRFTPRVMVQDNWGWCSGECRSTLVGGNLEDGTGPSVKVKHPFGGCYTGNVFNGTETERIRFNSQSTVAEPIPRGVTAPQLYVVSDGKGQGECKLELGPLDDRTKRPWIVYPGSLQLRRSDEIAR